MPEPELHKIRLNGVELAYFERGVPSPTKPTLLFVHATGFHGRVWDRIIESFDDYHTVAFEQRGHGRSERVVIEHWREFGDDIIAFVKARELGNLIAVGHSMGAHALVDAAGRCEAFARLVLLDPVIAAPEAYESDADTPFDAEHPAAKRRSHFSSVEEMMERLLPKSAFSLYEPRIFEDYCRFGLVPAESGGFELACHPTSEASVYMTARTNGGVYDSIRALQIPVTIVRAMERAGDSLVSNFSASPTWSGLVGELTNGREIHLADCTHFIPMQKPDTVVEIVREEVADWSPAP